MKKELLLCGFLFMYGVCADSALGTPEEDVANAVANALSSVSAKAENIAYSAADQTLVITGLEYAGQQEGAPHKGRIEQLRLEGFDEKTLLESGEAGAALPRVAEKAVLTGWTDTSEDDGVKMVLKMDSCSAQGWYQRLGALLKSSSMEDPGQFLEEVVRYRLDGVRSENINITLESAKQEFSPVSIAIKSIEDSGVPAPGSDAQPRKANLLMRDVSFASGDVSGMMEKFAFSGVIVPEPAQVAALWKKVTEAGGVDDPEAALKLLSEFYGGQPPFSLVALEKLKVWTSKNGDPAMLDSLSLDMDRPAEGPANMDFSMKALRLPPSVLGEFRDMAVKYAPEGVVFDMRVNGRTAEGGSDANATFTLRGLGSLELGCAVKGDAVALLKQLAAASDDDEALKKLLSEINVTSAKLAYEDTGLIPLVANFALESSDAIGLEGLNFALRYAADKGLNTDFAMKGLHVGLELLEQYKAEISRFAPGGLFADATSSCALTKEGYTGSSSVVARGLGKLDMGLAMKGDILGLLAKAIEDPDKAEELLPMLSQIKLAAIDAGYKDSGLAAMILSIASKEFEMPAADLIAAASGQAEGLAASGDPFFEKLGNMLKEQIAKPGEMAVSLAPGTDMDVMTFAMTAAESPNTLPLVFSSKPGSKSMEDYLK